MARGLTNTAPAVARRHCLYCSARARSPWGGLRDLRSLEELDSAHNLPRRIASGAAIINGGEAAVGVYTVLSGWIALTDTSADGRAANDPLAGIVGALTALTPIKFRLQPGRHAAGSVRMETCGAK